MSQLRGSEFAEVARHMLLMLAAQLLTVVAVSVGGAAIWDARTGYSLLVGGGIGLAGSAYLGVQLVRHSGRATAGIFGVFIAWGIKVALVMSLLVVAFRSGVFNPPAVLGGLGAGLVANWVWLSIDRRRTSTRDGN